MRIGRSLSPGKVFFERNGVLLKVDPEEMNRHKSSLRKSGHHRMHGILMQWGLSESMVVVDDIIFPIPFRDIPQVQVQVQTARADISQITTTGFRLRTTADFVHWSAFGR